MKGILNDGTRIEIPKHIIESSGHLQDIQDTGVDTVPLDQSPPHTYKRFFEFDGTGHYTLDELLALAHLGDYYDHQDIMTQCCKAIAQEIEKRRLTMDNRAWAAWVSTIFCPGDL